MLSVTSQRLSDKDPIPGLCCQGSLCLAHPHCVPTKIPGLCIPVVAQETINKYDAFSKTTKKSCKRGLFQEKLPDLQFCELMTIFSLTFLLKELNGIQQRKAVWPFSEKTITILGYCYSCKDFTIPCLKSTCQVAGGRPGDRPRQIPHGWVGLFSLVSARPGNLI